jgi:sedoheptulokinase
VRLGIDIGTTKTAAVIIDDEGRTVAVASHAHAADVTARGGRSEQDPGVLLDSAWRTVRELPADVRLEVDAVGVTGQMHGVVVLDQHGDPVSRLVTWQDGRCLEDERFLSDLRRETGRVLRSGFGCATLAWMAGHRELAPSAESAATIHDVAVARLCGAARAVTDPTDAASWGLFDLADLRWDEDAVAAAKVPRSLLPEIVPTGARAGTLCEAMADGLGLAPDIPVYAAIGDNQASLLATLRAPHEDVALTLGTGGQVSVVVETTSVPALETTEVPYEYRPFPGGRMIAVAASLSAGSAWAWLADTAAAWFESLGASPPPREEVFARLNELGLRTQNQYVVSPHFLGQRHAPEMRGAVVGLGGPALDLGKLARGLAWGIVGALREMLPDEVLAGRKRVIGSGNALRRNELLRRAAEDVFGLPLSMTEGREEAARGAAMLGETS